MRKKNKKTVIIVLGISVVAFALGYFIVQFVMGKPEKIYYPYRQLPKRVVVSPTKPTVVVQKPIIAQPVEAPKPKTPPISAKMAIILDDWGLNYGLLKKVIDLKVPITLAVIPHLDHSTEIAREAREAKLGVIIHMPMQPFSESQPLEPQTIKTSTPDVLIKQYVNNAIKDIPTAEGLNNHMGSKATSDERVMRTLLTLLKEKDLFFVDSNVVATTKGPKVAKELQIPYTKRDVFIDNESSKESIKKQLRSAKRIALKRGEVVVIGHDKKNTIEAIAELLPEMRNEGIQFVLVKDLVN